jgi:nitroreductase
MELIDVIKARRSIRKYQNKPITEDIINELLDCARLAPTAINIQPWLIGCVTDRVLLERLANLADHGRFIKGSAACFTVFCERGQKYYLEDGCAATMNIITAATAMGIGTCWVAGDKKEYVEPVCRLLNVPEQYTLVALVPAGYPDESPRKEKKKPADVTFRDIHR